MSKTEYNIAWNNQKLQIRWRCITYAFASLIEKYDIILYKSENFDVLKYCYEKYAHNAYVKEFIERMTVALEETSLVMSMLKANSAWELTNIGRKADSAWKLINVS